MKLTHTIGAGVLDSLCDRNLTDAEARQLARSLGTAIHLLEPEMNATAVAFLLGQVLHECGEFRFPRELWGPSGVQRGYWKRRPLQGDGPLFEGTPPKFTDGLGFIYRGGGWIQTTGRANFRVARERLAKIGIRFASARQLAAHAHEPEIASLLTVIWWTDHFPARMRLGDWSTLRVSRIVNLGPNATSGTPNGLDEREKFTDRAMAKRHRLRVRPI